MDSRKMEDGMELEFKRIVMTLVTLDSSKIIIEMAME